MGKICKKSWIAGIFLGVMLFAAGFAIGWLICGLFWLKVRVSLARAERKIKRLEYQIAPTADVPVTSGVPVAKE